MFYYEIVLLKSKAPFLVYSSSIDIKKGTLVTVSLHSKFKEGVILNRLSKKPDFKTFEIDEIKSFYYSSVILDMAKFIS